MTAAVMKPGKDNLDAEALIESEEIDISLLEESLRLTPWERLLENERSLALVRMLEAARGSANGTTASDPGAA